MSANTGRRLAAILSADAVDFSRLMAADEAATVSTITAYRTAIAQLVTEHEGRVVDAPGDNLLAEFPTATGALRCALAVQRSLDGSNADLDEARCMRFRIGVHLGEVRAEDGRLYGDGVNIAARLESLAEPGGICISGEVYAQTRTKLDIGYQDLGERSMKNLPEPVRVYRVTPEATVSASRRHDWLRWVSAAGAVVLVGVAAWLGWAAWSPGRSAISADGLPGGGFGDRPAIAVLPFDNLSGDPEQEYFADGIAEDLITRLSSWRSFPVIARNSSFVYKGRAVDLKQVGRELGARYVVEGSVRRSGNRVRIAAQLIDAPTNHHIWAETYDRDLTDVFAVQDEISTAIAASTQGGVRQLEGERAARRDPADLDAWDLLQRARWHLSRNNAPGQARAEELVTAALDVDPNLAGGYALLAEIRYRQLVEGRGAAGLEDVFAMARRAIELDARDAEGYVALAMALSLSGDRDELEATARQAIELNPSMPRVLGLLGVSHVVRGRKDQGFALIDKALRLAPTGPDVYQLLDLKSVAEVVAGNYEAADSTARKLIGHFPESPWPQLYHAVILWHLGRREEARSAFAEGKHLGPQISLELVDQGFSFLEPSQRALYVEPLAALGLESRQVE